MRELLELLELCPILSQFSERDLREAARFSILSWILASASAIFASVIATEMLLSFSYSFWNACSPAGDSLISTFISQLQRLDVVQLAEPINS